MSGRTIAIVGRPNVGKSTLFNRLVGARQAVVSHLRGTTRDRLHGQVRWRGIPLTLVDTGGMEFSTTEPLANTIQHQIDQACQEADLLLLVCDVQEGLLPSDAMIMDRLRRFNKPIILAVNKIDRGLTVPPDFFSLGLPHVLGISALHGLGTGDLLDQMVQTTPTVGQAPPATGQARIPVAEASTAALPSSVSLAIVGRQNVGKSSLLNALLREERVIVSEIPGTTRDAIDSLLIFKGQTVRLIDTAGLRHRRKVNSPIDLFSMVRSIEAIQRCDVALLVLDAVQGLTRDDQRIIKKVQEGGCGLVILVNKWVLIRGISERRLLQSMQRATPNIAFAPLRMISAKTGFHVQGSLEVALHVVRGMREGISPTILNSVLQRAWTAHPPPRYRGRLLRLQRASWVMGHPVRVELSIKPVARLPVPYQHYLLKALYTQHRLIGVPMALVVERSESFSPKRSPR